jgi:hypothetical protein
MKDRAKHIFIILVSERQVDHDAIVLVRRILDQLDQEFLTGIDLLDDEFLLIELLVAS